MFKVDKNITKPKFRGRGAPSKYPFKSMEVGDSFFVPVGKFKSISALNSSVMNSGAVSLGRRSNVSTCAVTEGGVEGVRAWRTA